MTNQRFGYGRVSTSDQNIESQKDALVRAGTDLLFIDTFTGTKSNRPELNRLRAQLRRGDTLVITRLDRLGRSAKDLLNLVSELQDQGVHLEVLEQNINTSTPEGKLFFTLVASFAEFEREIMRSRTMDGLAAARARGRMGGRKPAMSPVKIATAKQLYSQGKYVKDIAEALGVSRPTIYRALSNELVENNYLQNASLTGISVNK
jgi:DNA invertase Pin-like site-specific DNA recombinase